MKNYLILIFVTTTLICCSSKSIEPVVDDTFSKTLTASTWTVYESWIDPDQDGVFEKGALPDCETDNRHTFNVDGTFSYDTGPIACDPTQSFVLNGKWESSENDTRLKLTDLPDDIDYIVISITENELTLRPITLLEPDGSVYQRLILRR
jgi:Lipocalin-like domain